MLVVFDVEYFLDITTEIDDFLFVTQILSAFVDVLEFRFVLEILWDDEFCHFTDQKFVDVFAKKLKISVDFEELFCDLVMVLIVVSTFFT
jgi:hypothetical protein